MQSKQHKTEPPEQKQKSLMAIRSLISGVRRYKVQAEGRRNLLMFICTQALPIESSVKYPINRDCNLKNEILRLKLQETSVTSVLENWVGNGRKVTVSQLRYIARLLMQSRRYKHALEIFSWMENRKKLCISAADHAVRLELIMKVLGLMEAEEYFKLIPDSAGKKAASLPLLQGYVKERDTLKAEALMMNMNNLGLIVSTHPFNEMMKLYMATSQYEKVPSVILKMKQNKIPLNILSYNLWMTSCGEAYEIAKAEMIYKEMVNDTDVEVGWSTLSTLADIYIKAGLVEKAQLALRNAEKKLSTSNRLGYFFLITQYSSLKNKEEVWRLWEASKRVGGRITCANYMCIMSCLVKVGDLVKAEKVFIDWESNCQKYDIRVSNVLLGTYMRTGLINKAESLHLHALERGGCPNYKTCEILMEGWVKNQKMDKAIIAMKQAFRMMLKNCDWRPSHDILMAMAKYFEKSRNLEEATRYIRVIHHLGLTSLPLCKIFLRMHLVLDAQRAAFDILRMMEKDKIEIDDEISTVIQAFEYSQSVDSCRG